MQLLVDRFEWLARKVSLVLGHPLTFLLALLTIVVWGVIGPFVGFSEIWQLSVNTGTTIITFLMLFLVQNTQNRDASAIHVKLDALIAASEAHNEHIGIEDDSAETIKRLHVENLKQRGELQH